MYTLNKTSGTPADPRILEVKVAHKWQPGDRITRNVYMDDGTFSREGDKCLPFSPKYHGKVVRRATHRDDEVVVVFDGTTREKWFLDHGLQAE